MCIRDRGTGSLHWLYNVFAYANTLESYELCSSAIILLYSLANLLFTFCCYLIIHVEALDSTSQSLESGGWHARLSLSYIFGATFNVGLRPTHFTYGPLGPLLM